MKQVLGGNNVNAVKISTNVDLSVGRHVVGRNVNAVKISTNVDKDD